MCGGFTIAKDIESIRERFNVEFDEQFLPRYNARPAQFLPIILSEDPGRLVMAHWGLKPVWLAKIAGNKELINTRNDSIMKPSFKHDLRTRRCLVVADGFLEWEKKGGAKIPHRFGLKDHALFAMAGIYEPDKEGFLRFSIITTEPNRQVGKIHNRMPVMLAQSREKEWLEDSPELEQYLDFLRPFSDTDFGDELVSGKINSSANEGPELLNVVGQ